MRGDTIPTRSSEFGHRLSTLLQQFVWIALLKGRPQDLPSGVNPFQAALGVNIFTYVIAVASVRSIPSSIMLALVDVAVTGLCLFIAVSLVDKRARFYQAGTALFGGTAVINLAAIPVLWLSSLTGQTAIGLLDVMIILWGLAIISHVLRHTLEVNPWISVGLAVAFYIIVLQLLVVTGVIGAGPENDQQLSIYQTLSPVWLSKA